MDADAAGRASRGVCGQHKRNGVSVGADEAGVGAGAVCRGNSTQKQRNGGDWDPDTETHRVRKVMAMVDYGGAMGRTKGHTVQVVSPQESAAGVADQGVTDLVQYGRTWWVVEPGRRHW